MMYEEETANLEPMMYDEEALGFEPVGATRWEFIWLCGLVLSFCYERSLAQLTTMMRVNPRLFDIVFIVGMITVFPNLNRVGRMPKLFRIWAGIVATFCVCAVIWAPFFPWYYGKYTIFYALKYLQGLLVMYMVVRISLTSDQKKVLCYMVVVGGIVVACYAIPQYVRGGARPVYVPRLGKELVSRRGALGSSLGGYLHLGMYSALASVMTLSLYHSLRTTVSKLFCLGLGLFVSWPAFACGARAGVVACLVGWTSLFLLAKASFKTTIIVLVIGASSFIFLYAPKVLSLEYLKEKSLTFERFGEGERKGAGYAIMSRLTVNWYRLDLYKWQGWRIPFVGAGFYVTPHTYPNSSTRKYRIAYGIHNSYLFALEQGGFVAFVLFIAFLIACRNNLKRMRSSGNEVDRAFATGMYAFFYALLVVMLGGQIFWYGFGKVNFNTYMIVLFFLASKMSFSLWPESICSSGSNPEYEDTFVA